MRTMLLLLAIFIAIPVFAVDYTVDGSHSTVMFSIKHKDVSNFYGQFNKVSGELSFDKSNVGSCKLTVTIPSKSIFTANKKRDDHLKSADFFNVDKFKTVSFESSAWKDLGKGKYEVQGSLKLHGVKKQVTATVDLVGLSADKKAIGIEGRFSIKRSEYGMNFLVGKGLGDDINILVSLEGVQK